MAANIEESRSARFALRCAAWAERWFPDSWVFAALAVVIVTLATLAIGARPTDAAKAFGDGFWSLIPFTMQMAFVVIGGYVVASSPPAVRLIDRLARVPRNGRSAVAWVALISMLASLLNWGLSLVFGGLLVRALARRTDLRMDYRAAGAAAYLGLGAVWALGLSSSAAQLQANPASLPPSILAITGVIPFTETIFLWQSGAMLAALVVISLIVAYATAPGPNSARDAKACGIDPAFNLPPLPARTRPGEWLEYSPLLIILMVLLGVGWLFNEFSNKPAITAISGLNTYNFLFIMLGALLHWRPRSFLDAVARAVPTTTGVLIQFPLYGSIAALLTTVKGADAQTLAHYISTFFTSIASHDTYAILMGVYSAILGFFIPSGGGKWIIEAPYVMQVANDLQYHLGWAVQIYNAAEALPNLINPFYMLPLLGVLGLKARDLIGFSFVQLLVHAPLVLFLLWALGSGLWALGARHHADVYAADHALTLKGVERVIALHLADPRGKRLIPMRAALLADLGVLGLLLPGQNRRLVGPVGNGHTQPIVAARRLHTQKARLLTGQFDHPLCGRCVRLPLVRRTQRGEHHREVRRGKTCRNHDASPAAEAMQARIKASTTGGIVPSSAARSDWNSVATKNGCPCNSMQRTSPSGPRPLTFKAAPNSADSSSLRRP